MIHDEKTVFVHWYYSASEWKQFMKEEKRHQTIILLIEAFCVAAGVLLIMKFAIGLPWLLSAIVTASVSLFYAVMKYLLQIRCSQPASKKMAEITILNGIATINGRAITFNTDGKSVKNAHITETGNINILEITYEWQSGSKINLDELKVPVPKGKLREAVKFLDTLSIKSWLFL